MESINWPWYNQLESPETILRLFERTQTNAKERKSERGQNQKRIKITNKDPYEVFLEQGRPNFQKDVRL